MKKFFKVLLPVLLVALLLGGGIWYLRNYQGDFFSNFLQRRGDAAMAGRALYDGPALLPLGLGAGRHGPGAGRQPRQRLRAHG